MKIKKANIQRLASLSALGAGALGFTAGQADAGSIVYSGVLDEQVGFGPGFQNRLTLAGPNGVGGVLDARTIRTVVTLGSASWQAVRLGGRFGVHGTQFAFPVLFEYVQAVPAGSEWRGGGDFSASLAGQERGGTPHWSEFNATDRYLLFEFTGGRLPQTMYGWAQLEVSFDPNGPEVTLVDWAYDTSGAEIPAGDTGTPEPSTFALTGLAALALGARGLRAWRAARAMA